MLTDILNSVPPMVRFYVVTAVIVAIVIGTAVAAIRRALTR